MKNRQYIIIFLFTAITLSLSIYSYVGNFKESKTVALGGAPSSSDEMDESYFRMVELYLLSEGKPFLQLDSTDLTLSNGNTQVVGSFPKGVVYRKSEETDKAGKEEEPIFFTAKTSQIFTERKELYLKDTVDVSVGTANLKANQVSIFNNGKHLEAQGGVRTISVDPKTDDQILINSDFAIYRPKEQFFEYQKHVSGVVQRRRKYEESVSFTTDLLTLASLKSQVEMKGNVTFKKGNLDASANLGTVFLENYNKKLKYYSLSDDVRLQETLTIRGIPKVRKAFAEKLEGLISDRKIILTGLPKVFQEKDVIKGNRITIRENIETVEVDDANTNITLERDESGNM